MNEVNEMQAESQSLQEDTMEDEIPARRMPVVVALTPSSVLGSVDH